MPPAGAVPDQARETIREALKPFGYDAPYVRFGWQVPNSEVVLRYTDNDTGDPETAPEGAPRFLDALAFADPKRQDWNTSAIAVDLRQDEAVGTEASKKKAHELFRLTAAPTNVIGSLARKRVDVWFNCHDGIVGREGVDFSSGSLRTVFREHRPSVQRDLLAHLRAGQHHLFEGHLYARRDELANFLQRGVSKATWVIRDKKWGQNKEQETLSRVSFSRVALALLAARILEDKGALGEDRGQSTDARQLLTEAHRKWDAFFNQVMGQDLAHLDKWFGPRRTDLMLRCLLSHLTGPVNFGLVTHEMLGDLYERVLVAQRSAGSRVFIDLKGVHYTPLGIARRILDHIPLEDLPASERIVCDLACGSGSFLLAATDRLAAIFDPREPGAGADRTTWLRHSVLGNDIDQVAILVARLSYLIAYWNRVDEAKDIPYPLLREADALSLDFKKVFERVPSVFVGNPPFDIEGHPASEFLERALISLLNEKRTFSSFIGMVMPGAFLKGKTEQEAVRNKLLANARILEVWELPEHSIGMCADTPTCVLIAEVTGNDSPVKQLVRTCQTRSRRDDAVVALRDRGVTTWSYTALLNATPVDGEQISPDALAFSPIDDIWGQLLAQGAAFSALAEAVWGFIHTKWKGQLEPEFSDRPGDGFVPYIRQQSALRPFVIKRQDWEHSHEDEFRFWKKGTGYSPRPSNWAAYESPKIVISAQSNRNANSQLVAALDFSRYYPGKHFLAVTLRPDWRAQFQSIYASSTEKVAEKNMLRWLCGILNSPLGHAWFAKHAGPRGPQADVCLTMTLPLAYAARIAELVHQIESMPRPQNIRNIPTWNPEAGIVETSGHLFKDGSEALTLGNDYWRAVSELNKAILNTYALSDAQQRRIMAFMTGMTNPWVEHSAEVSRLTDTTVLRVLRGKTVSLNVLDQILTAKFSWKSLGNGAAVSIPTPKFMPGWALQAGREFTCRAPSKCSLKDLGENHWLLREFQAVPYDYLSIETLEAMIGYRKEPATP